MAAIRIIDDHIELASIGSNTHAQIDTHVTANHASTNSVLLETVTVENTVVETIIWTAEMSADSLEAGNVVKIHADGIINNGGATAADEITLRVNVGGVTVATLNPSTKALTDAHWHLNVNGTQRTIGVAGQRATHLELVIEDVDDTCVVGVTTIDTTANMDATITVQWASADVANVFELYQAFVEYMNIKI